MDRTLEQRLTEFLDREDRKIEEAKRKKEAEFRIWEHYQELVRRDEERIDTFFNQLTNNY